MKYKLTNQPINQLINRSVINNQPINRSVTLTYGVQTFLAPVGTVISTCPRRDLGLNLGLDLITRNPEGPISKTKQNHNLNTHYIRGAMSEKNYGVLYMSCSLIWYKQYCSEIHKLHVLIFSIRRKTTPIKRTGQLWPILMRTIFRETMSEKKMDCCT